MPGHITFRVRFYLLDLTTRVGKMWARAIGVSNVPSSLHLFKIAGFYDPSNAGCSGP